MRSFQVYCTSAASIRNAAAKLLRRNAGIAELFPLPPSSTSTSFLHSSAIVCGRRSAKIATRKGAQDLKKAKLYGKLGKLILASARQGGPDPVANPKLRDAVAAAKAAALPKEIIDRNIKKAGEKAGGADFSEVLYEAYGPGGSKTGFIVEALTDNVNRTAAEVKTAIKSANGKVADGGSVRFGFDRAGVVVLDPAAAGQRISGAEHCRRADAGGHGNSVGGGDCGCSRCPPPCLPLRAAWSRRRRSGARKEGVSNESAQWY